MSNPIFRPQIGFHGGGGATGGNHNGIGESWERLRKAGAPVVFCSVLDRGIIRECYSGKFGAYPPYNPAVDTLIYRELVPLNRPNDTPYYFSDSGIEYAKDHLAHTQNGNQTCQDFLLEHPGVMIGYGNETNKDDDASVEWQHDFFLDAARYTNGLNIPCVVENWAGGNPEPHHWLSPSAERLLRYASQSDGMCAIGMHLYSLIPNGMENYESHWGRWRDVIAACDHFGIHPYPRIIAKEFGHGLDGPKVGFIDQMRDMFEAGDDPLIARCIWDLAGLAGNQTQQWIEGVTNFVLDEAFARDIRTAAPLPLPELSLDLSAFAIALANQHPSKVGVIETEHVPALRRSIHDAGEIPASSEISFTFGQHDYVVQIGRKADATVDDDDTFHLARVGEWEQVSKLKQR